MIQFKPITKQDGNKLRKYYADCDYGLCAEDPDYDSHFCVDCGSCCDNCPTEAIVEE